jgi:hypothetical protein
MKIYYFHHELFVIDCASDNLEWKDLIIHQTIKNNILLFKCSNNKYTLVKKYHYYNIDVDCFYFS